MRGYRTKNKNPTRQCRDTRRETSPGTKAGSSKKQEIMMEQPPFLSKVRRDKKGDKKGGKPRTRAGTSKKQEIMMEQRPFLARIENSIQSSLLGAWLKMGNVTQINKRRNAAQ